MPSVSTVESGSGVQGGGSGLQGCLFLELPCVFAVVGACGELGNFLGCVRAASFGHMKAYC